MTKLADAREAFAAAVAFRAALLRMRTVMGNPLATPTACGRTADVLLNDSFPGRTVSDAELTKLGPQIEKASTRLEKISVVLGDRTMKAQEIYRALVESGIPETASLRHEVTSQLGKHCGSNGRGLFTKVRNGWYRLKKPGDKELPSKLPKGLLVRGIYDALAKDVLSAAEVSSRLLSFGNLRPDQCARARVGATLNQHTDKGYRCFVRVGQGTYKRRQDHPPTIETPVSVVVDAICTVLRHGPLSYTEIYEKFCERFPKHTDDYNPRRLREIIRGNTGKHGRRVFMRVGKTGVDLAEPDLLEQIMKVMGSGDPLSPKQVTDRIGDIGKTFALETVGRYMLRYSGFGLPLRRVRDGIYIKNPDYRKASK